MSGLGTRRRRAAVALAACAALAVPVATAASASAAVAQPSAGSPVDLNALLARLQGLYRKAEAATDAYNTVVVKEQTLQKQQRTLSAQIKATRAKLASQHDQAGALAREQYREAGTGGLADLLAGKDPQDTLDVGQALKQAAGRQAGVLTDLEGQQARLKALKAKSDQAVAQAKKLAAQQKKAAADVQKQLAAVQGIIMSLTGAQLDQLLKLEQQQINAAQLALLHSGKLGRGERYPSAAGKAALEWAFGQLGKPYLWGGDGPGAFDCSGLTSQAWAHAGVAIPRTSQQQWAQLTRVPLDRIRPGDLVVYFADASHVAMYIGNGLIIEAPRPGTVIKIADMASMPIKGVVRPDPLAPSVDNGYRVPGGAAASGASGIGFTGASMGTTGASSGGSGGGSPSHPKPSPSPSKSRSTSAKPSPTPRPTATASGSAKPGPSASVSTSTSASGGSSVSPTPSGSPSPTAG
ncbi:hypothetical protein BIV57_18720 [Mangrovactinospora gilvigrisea]|uniref:NlpC/P60 domain-containing protein n=1 Tax=Mangrovactinospora gilvigrisea TaxID=1428644 RepID=A0A1J7BBF0_9ACTN|nr:NlpC/P60 family protein [Mangrovactinospora gilvigrisea]OIV36007.1 hypothetical protein BIV57_18720 [Mangrovactinospora gilvigrisea]